MRNICVVTLLLFISVVKPVIGQEKLHKVKLEDGIVIKIPGSFIVMSETDMWQRVSSYRKSLALYTDMDRLVELGINRSYSVWEEGDYEMMYEVYKTNILELYDEVKFLNEGIIELHKRPFVMFEFESKVFSVDGNRGPITKYTYIEYTIHNGQTLVFNFSCPVRMEAKWRETAGQIMESVVLKK